MNKLMSLLTALIALPYGLALWVSGFARHHVESVSLSVVIFAVLLAGSLLYRSKHADVRIPGADIARRLVLGNQILVGSVNAARDHFQVAVDDLVQAGGKYMARLITHRHAPGDFDSALGHHAPDEIKAVIEWAFPV
jgi:hypothetical protein